MLLFGLVFLAGTMDAQSTFGIKGGVNFSNLAVDKDQVDKTKTSVGFSAGISLKMNLLEWFALQPELLYTTKGAEYEFGSTTVDANLHYLDIPVLASIRLFNSPLSVYAGPQFSYLLKAKYKIENPLLGEETLEDDNNENYEDWDLGLVAGLSLNFENFVIEARFNKGFRTVEKEDAAANIPFIGNDVKNFGFGIMAGFVF